MVGLAAVATGALGACITQVAQYEVAPNTPPSVETPDSISPHSPLNRIVRLSDLTMADGGVGSGDLVLDALVRDANLDQVLHYRLFLNYTPGSSPIRDNDIPPTGVLERRVTITLAAADLSARACNRIELLVTSEAWPSAARPRDPAEPGDVGTATWFVVRDDTVSLGDCRPW